MNQGKKTRMITRFNKFLKMRYGSVKIEETGPFSIKINSKSINFPSFSDLDELWLGQVIVNEILLMATKLEFNKQDRETLENFWLEESRRGIYKKRVDDLLYS